MLDWFLRFILRRPWDHRALGRAGERLAASRLRREGFRVLARNVRVPAGEADLVCLAPDRRTLVIVEVKTRLAPAGGPAYPPEVNIDGRKRRKLVEVARSMAARRDWRGRPVRIDVVAVEWSPAGRHVVRHHPDAVAGW